eukprot:jgi/Botrbrau1/16664/Bobra.0068s0080.1
MARGRQVLTHMFPDSPHVKHFMQYREEYVQAVRELLEVTAQSQCVGLVSQSSVIVQLTLGDADKSGKQGLTKAATDDIQLMSLSLHPSLKAVGAKIYQQVDAVPFANGTRLARATPSWSEADLLDLEALLHAACMV